jgi:hypothetical protein
MRRRRGTARPGDRRRHLGLLHVDAVGGDPHQQVGAGPRAQLARPARQPLGGCLLEVRGQRGDLEPVILAQCVGLGHHLAEARLGREVVRAVHEQQRPDEEVTELLVQVGHPPQQGLGVLGQRRPVGVAHRQVLGPDHRAVGRGPPEPGGGHVRRHAAPHDGVAEPGLGEQLGHLGDVAEHVGQVAHLHGAAETGRRGQAQFEIAHDGLAGHQELVAQHVPRAHREPAGGHQRPQAVLGLRSHLEVVVDDRHLAVEEEVGVGGVRFEEGHQRIERVHQAVAEDLIGLVPLTVPVGVRYHGDTAHRPRLGLVADDPPATAPRPAPRAIAIPLYHRLW